MKENVKEGDEKNEIKKNEMKRERRLLSPLKAPDSIETRLLERKLQNDGKE